MSANQSNLTAYGFDMVTGVTQASVNATMKQFLYQFEGKEFVMCYVAQKNPVTGEWVPVPTDYEKLKAELGIDPFDIPNNDVTNPYVQRLYNEFKFKFGFKASMGLPEMPIWKIPDIIELNQGNQSVGYNLVCKTFEILELTVDYDDFFWKNLSQSEYEAPWIFNFLVSLNLSDDKSAFSKLPEYIQEKVKNLCPDTIFTVEQLYLDLNTPGLITMPTIEGLDPSSYAYLFLNRVFINTYFKNLQDQNKGQIDPKGNFILGYSIKPLSPSPNPSLIPTDLNFVVSPYHDEQKPENENYDLYTLNYLVMSDNGVMPTPRPFSWNWVDASTQDKFHGVISIRKEKFVAYLQKSLSASLYRISLIPIATIDVGFTLVTISAYYINPPSGDVAYQIKNDGSNILSFNYEKEAKDDDWFIPNWGDIAVKTNTKSNVYLEGTTIRIVTEITVHIYLNICGGVIQGNYVKYKTEVPYLLEIDSFGQLWVKRGEVNFTDSSDEIDPNWWSKFITLGQIEDVVDYFKNYLAFVKSFLTGQADVITAMLNGSNVWLFPGGKTFAFKNAAFSDHLDLIAEVTYVDPSAARINNQMTAELFEIEQRSVPQYKKQALLTSN